MNGFFKCHTHTYWDTIQLLKRKSCHCNKWISLEEISQVQKDKYCIYVESKKMEFIVITILLSASKGRG